MNITTFAIGQACKRLETHEVWDGEERMIDQMQTELVDQPLKPSHRKNFSDRLENVRARVFDSLPPI